MKISDKGLARLKGYEKLELTAYRCPAGIWTIGWGHTGPDVWPNLQITETVATNLLRADCAVAETCVESNVTVPLTQDRFDSLVTFVFNIGCGAFKKSTLLKKLNAGEPVKAEFRRWNKSNGKVQPGLITRRAEEAEAFS